MKKLAIVLAVLCFASAALADDFMKDADLAWTWYPQDKKELAGMIQGYLDAAQPSPIDGHILAIIAPHAGYQFSGPVAGYAYKAAEKQDVKTVVILGFSHRRFFDGVSVYDRGVWRTPLGDVAVDDKVAKVIVASSPRFKFEPGLFKSENSLEMQVPFIQVAFKGAKIVPVAFGTRNYDDAENLAKALADIVKIRNDVLIVASTDLSHFHPYAEANTVDNAAIETLKKIDPKLLYDDGLSGRCEFCGLLPVTTVLMVAKELGYDSVRMLKYANSGDTYGDKARVVGYLSAAIYKEAPKLDIEPVVESKAGKTGNGPVSAVADGKRPAALGLPAGNIRPANNLQSKRGAEMLTDFQKKRLLQIARGSIANFVVFRKKDSFKEDDRVLNEPRGAFVTLHEDGQLRGCIGNIVSRQPLFRTVSDMAIEAATADPRFRPVTADELNKVDIEVSVLTPLKRVKNVDEIKIPGHGVLIKKGASSGVFLPQVATETGWSKEEFLSTLCAHKAGLPRDAWKDPKTELYIFSAEVFGEKDVEK